MATVTATLKGRNERIENLERPSRRFEEILQDLAGGQPRQVARLLEIWTRTAIREAKVRWDYPVVWRDPLEGEIRFHAIVSVASEPAGLGFNDWHPRDAESWARLERVLSRPAPL